MTHRILVSKWGQNADVDAFSTPEDVIAEGGLQYWAAAAAKLDITSSAAADTIAGTGAQQLRIEGLDANYTPIGESVGMNGVTIVETKQLFLRVNRAYVLQAGTGEENAGIITIHDGTGVMSTIAISYGQTTKASYTLPIGVEEPYVSGIRLSVAEKVSHTAIAAMFTRSVGSSSWRMRQLMSANESNAAYLVQDTEGFSLAPRDDVLLRVIDADADNLFIVGGFTIHTNGNH